MRRKGPAGETRTRRTRSGLASARPPLVLFALLALVWTWPLALHFRDHIPGFGGDNYSFVWNLWWMRKALSAPDLDFFRSTYLFSPFGVDLINHPHTALQGYLSATLLAGLTVMEAENLYVIGSVFMNAVCAYALAFDIVRDRRWALVAAVAFGSCPYIAAHLMGHFDLLAAWVIPLFALCFRRSIRTGSVAAAMGGGVCIAIAAVLGVLLRCLSRNAGTGLHSRLVGRDSMPARGTWPQPGAHDGPSGADGADGGRSVPHRRHCGLRRRPGESRQDSTYRLPVFKTRSDSFGSSGSPGCWRSGVWPCARSAPEKRRSGVELRRWRLPSRPLPCCACR